MDAVNQIEQPRITRVAPRFVEASEGEWVLVNNPPEWMFKALFNTSLPSGFIRSQPVLSKTSEQLLHAGVDPPG
ncbi:MAG: hypothetical protein L0Z62_41875 [Gemmataceae bacterium]|nr:hypothetical protein [Gemmataceae bacterium]